jgi:hypothetical protein
MVLLNSSKYSNKIGIVHMLQMRILKCKYLRFQDTYSNKKRWSVSQTAITDSCPWVFFFTMLGYFSPNLHVGLEGRILSLYFESRGESLYAEKTLE